VESPDLNESWQPSFVKPEDYNVYVDTEVFVPFNTVHLVVLSRVLYNVLGFTESK
jgi:hypothetical protein